jgi:hypothetical protein
VKTRARKDGDHYIINGENTWITNGAYSDMLVCTCRTSDDPKRGLTHFLLAGMADKYWMDILIRHESHPMVARLVPEAPPSELSRVHLAKGLARPPQISKVRRNDRSRAARIDNLGDHGFAPVGGVGDDEVKVVIRLVPNLKKHGADRVCGQLDRRGAPIVRQEGRSRQSVQGDYRRGHRLEINAVAVLV